MAPQEGCAGAQPQLKWYGPRLPIPAACPRRVFPELLTQERCGGQSNREILLWLSPRKREALELWLRLALSGRNGAPHGRAREGGGKAMLLH